MVRGVLDDFNLRGWPKTSGKRGLHVYVRIQPRWTFDEVRRAALALAREVERRAAAATSKWWKEERHGVFVDYNQNAKDRTVAAAYSVRPTPDATVSAPLLGQSRLRPRRLHPRHHAGALQEARRPACRHRQRAAPSRDFDLFDKQGLGDAPWPPHYRKQASSRRAFSLRKGKFHWCKSPAPAARKTRSPAWSAGKSGTPRPRAPRACRCAGRRHARPLQHLDAHPVNLQHVPEALRPPQEPLDPDEKILSSS